MQRLIIDSKNVCKECECKDVIEIWELNGIHINRAARTGEISLEKITSNTIDGELKFYASSLFNLEQIVFSICTTEEIIVNRAVKTNLANIYKNMKVGENFEYSSYMSTTSFEIRRKSFKDEFGNYLMKIKIPIGTPCFYVSCLAREDEIVYDEILFPPGTLKLEKVEIDTFYFSLVSTHRFFR